MARPSKVPPPCPNHPETPSRVAGLCQACYAKARKAKAAAAPAALEESSGLRKEVVRLERELEAARESQHIAAWQAQSHLALLRRIAAKKPKLSVHAGPRDWHLGREVIEWAAAHVAMFPEQRPERPASGGGPAAPVVSRGLALSRTHDGRRN